MAEQLRDDLWLIDLQFQGVSGVVASYLLMSPDGQQAALIDTGPTSTLPALLAGVQSAGIAPERITALCLTHIHLDHAGAAGTLIEQACPRATVYVHAVGAPHLLDPTRLMMSAERIYGDRMEALWGQMRPVAADRVHVVPDATIVNVAGHRVQALETPGHARHHLAYYDFAHGAVFCGDVGGVAMRGAGYVRPPTPPPDIDIPAWDSSIARLLALSPTALYLAHFGPTGDPRAHLRQLQQRLHAWTTLVAQHMSAGETAAQITEALIASSLPELDAVGVSGALRERYQLAGAYAACVDGLMRYVTKRASSTT